MSKFSENVNKNKEETNKFQTQENIKLFAENIQYCGPSPDEISLLSGCKDICGFFFIGADSKKVVIQTPNIKLEVEKIISNEFESDRKMMSVLIKHNGKGKLQYF
jgi:magnesium-transporting ATPase (P-type)